MEFTFQLVGIGGEYNSIYMNIEDIYIYILRGTFYEGKLDGATELRGACGEGECFI